MLSLYRLKPHLTDCLITPWCNLKLPSSPPVPPPPTGWCGCAMGPGQWNCIKTGALELWLLLLVSILSAVY